MIRDRYNKLVLVSLVAAAASLVCVMISIGTESDAWSVVSVVVLMTSVVCVLFALAFSAMPDRRPLLPLSPYKALKRKTVRKLRKENRHGQLTERKLKEHMDDFVYDAVMLGYARYTAEMDWIFEIQWKVKR